MSLQSLLYANLTPAVSDPMSNIVQKRPLSESFNFSKHNNNVSPSHSFTTPPNFQLPHSLFNIPMNAPNFLPIMASQT